MSYKPRGTITYLEQIHRLPTKELIKEYRKLGRVLQESVGDYFMIQEEYSRIIESELRKRGVSLNEL